MLGAGQDEFGVRSDTVKRALQYIRSFARPDGGIYDKFYPNYTTGICAMALVEAGLAEDEELLRMARRFLLGLQADEREGIAGDNPGHGGWGYEKGDDEQEGHRPDLSNTQMAIEAVRALEEAAEEDRPDEEEDEEQTLTELAYGRAIQYLMRCQNDDGGFIYRPDESKAGECPDGGLRSYGSMTYAGLKSMIHARLKSGDPRVRAAFEWARAHWSVTENPGMGQQGLYYYYQTMVKALRVYGQDVVVDTRGDRHDWRVELVDQLLRVQHADGSWVNENGRWMERIPEFVTAYSLLAIDH
ncbi:MAG: terpene cyclase/mutase family protein, partial [Candidatus Brocadiia bacterium]|nr:terpene cyclase/mutase family protein [Candidatus Brocadiia bacterium]